MGALTPAIFTELANTAPLPAQHGKVACIACCGKHTLVAMGIVEVKDTEQHCFYRAKLLDVKQDKCLVQYEEAEGSSAPQTQSWVHSQLVRREPPEQSQVRIEQVSPSLSLSLSLCRLAVGRPALAALTCASHPTPTPPPASPRLRLPAPRQPHAVRRGLGLAWRCVAIRAHTRVPPPPPRSLSRGTHHCCSVSAVHAASARCPLHLPRHHLCPLRHRALRRPRSHRPRRRPRRHRSPLPSPPPSSPPSSPAASPPPSPPPSPPQGAIVEVSVKADGESEPASWWEAEVKEMREDFIKGAHPPPCAPRPYTPPPTRPPRQPPGHACPPPHTPTTSAPWHLRPDPCATQCASSRAATP